MAVRFNQTAQPQGRANASSSPSAATSTSDGSIAAPGAIPLRLVQMHPSA
jgi:hypothetical protein